MTELPHPGGSYVVRFLVLACFLTYTSTVLPKMELHWSLQVDLWLAYLGLLHFP